MRSLHTYTRDPYPDGRASRLHFRARLAWAVAAVIAAFGLMSLWGSDWSPTTFYAGTWTVAGTVAVVGGLLQRSATRVWRGTGPDQSRPVPTSPVPPVLVPELPPLTSPDPGRPPAAVEDQPGPGTAPPVPAARPDRSVRPELLPRPAELSPSTEPAGNEAQWDPILAEKW